MLERASSAPRGTERLATRRRGRRRRLALAIFLFTIALALAAVLALRQPTFRIARIEVSGTATPLEGYARSAMQGYYLGLIPRDSFFFFPAGAIRNAILYEHPDIGAISIFRTGLTGISIKAIERVPIARWCGSEPVAGALERCFLFDASGYVYAAQEEASGEATSTRALPTVNTFALYGSLEGDAIEPLRSTVAHAQMLPGTFDFARELALMGSPTTRVVLRGDEVDDILASGTRITYVLAHEQDAYTALVSARGNLNLADGSLEYVDLRFPGKVYLKKRQ